MNSALLVFLVDTNILVYMFDPRDEAKRQVATTLYRQLVASRSVALSVQCLTEFFNAVTRRLPVPMTPAQAQAEMVQLALACQVFPLTEAVVLDAARGVVQHQLAWWDALIWAVARAHSIPYVLTEDAPDGRVLEGVTYHNPFLPSFRLPALPDNR